jgi:hypothetical protein
MGRKQVLVEHHSYAAILAANAAYELGPDPVCGSLYLHSSIETVFALRAPMIRQ